jgi:hypothetical protein
VELGKEMNVQQLEQVQTLVQEAEQPIAQAVVPMQEANAVPVQAPIASSTAHLPNDNGARRVVPTNTLVLNGIAIEVDPVTFMVNATQMCRAAGKLFGHYWQRDSTKNYLQELSSDIGIPISEIYKKNQGGRGTSQDTSVHFRLALHLAYWLSTEVQLQFSKWIGELRIENADLSTQIEELRANAALVPIAIASARLSNANGAHKPLVLNGLVIEVDPDTFMVNATMMCKAAGKLFGDYRRQKNTDEYLQGLISNMGIPIFDLIQSKPGHNGGTMVHRLIAFDLASWLSNDVKIQFYMWIDELLLTGRVELGNEMNVQQLEDVWRRKVQEKEDKASADLSAEQDRSRDLEMQLATIQDAQGVAQQHKMELMAIKVREDLEAAIKFQVNTTAPRIATYKEGDNVLYLARVDGTKFKYGCSKNVGRRFDAHKRPGVYPTFEPIGILPCANAVASEDKVRAYVKKNKLGAEYGTQREVVVLESVDALQRMMKKMYKFCLQQHVTTQPANEGADVVLRRIDADASIKMKKIEADVDMKKIEADVDMKKIEEAITKTKAGVDIKKIEAGMENTKIETMRMQMLINKIITVEQYLQIKNT